ncbi:MAG: histidine--tRNA ligase [Candidatus Paceibacterota bacterium]|jgi:histidyl-tRNA synthetase|nr:histidine--tRNA ligase [Candidatus Paceibacterota bacterium]MDD4830847.1 histidine--tRNA ligase [Candidatus Paceibacterota bacterium]MDD4875080.1 histidine--tRNA ligase [Candidatus Paceibacterota bacterium]
MDQTSQKINPTVLDGFLELSPAEQVLFNKMLKTIQETYELFGFIPQETALIEKLEVLLAKSGGETAKQIFYLQKPDQALRFDLTVSLARYVAQNYRSLQFPYRRYQIGKVYRGERPQKGRYREFYQCDIDVIGDGRLGLINDAEIPSVIYAVFKKLGFEAFTIRINNRKILTGFFDSLGISGDLQKEVLRVVDKLEKIGSDAVAEELAGLGIAADTISKIFAFLDVSGRNKEIIDQLKKLGVGDEAFNTGVEELEQVLEAISRFGVPEKNIALDLKIARGLDYYTGTVYETFLDEYPGVGSVCSGGRYDNLAECYCDKNFPGVGISIGLTRLFSKLLEMKVIKPEESTPAQILVIPLDGQLDRAIEVAAAFREKGISAQVYLEEAKPGKVFKYADRLKVPYAAVIGGKEVASGKIALKDMARKEQTEASINDAIGVIKHHHSLGDDG